MLCGVWRVPPWLILPKLLLHLRRPALDHVRSILRSWLLQALAPEVAGSCWPLRLIVMRLLRVIEALVLYLAFLGLILLLLGLL